MSKTDLVSVDDVRLLEQRLKKMNPRAPITAAHFGEAPIDQLLDIRGFDLSTVLEIEPDFLTDVTHEHDDDVSSFVFRAVRPFDSEKLEDFFGVILKIYGSQLMRYKGVIAVAGADNRIVLQGVHMLMGTEAGSKWKTNEARESRIVFIGKKLPKDVLVHGLEQCLAPVQKLSVHARLQAKGASVAQQRQRL